MTALAIRSFAAIPPAPADAEDAPAAISSDLILLLMLGVGVLLTILLIGFFAFVMWYESKRSGTNPEAKDEKRE